VLINLLENAVKFTEKGRIDVSVALVEHSADWIGLQFSVRDTGPGVAPDRQHLIFDAFSQANGSSTRTHGGTGLGLAICSRLIRGMGGDIWLDSSPGAGSTFHFTARLGVSKPVTALGPHWPHAIDVRAWIVSDNPGSRRQLQNLLVSWNFRARAVAAGADGVSALADLVHTQHPNVILLEHAGSDGDEFATAAALRSHAPDAKIIVLTAAGLRGDAARCRENGISGYLAHPVPDSDLREAIMLTLETPHDHGGSPLITRHTLRERRHHLSLLQAEDGAIDRRRAAALPVAADAQSAPGSRPGVSKVFDRGAVLRNLGGDAEILEAIATTFLSGYANSLGQLQQAVAAGDFDSVFRAAHSIKGAAGSFFAQPVVHAALNVEACARHGDAAALNDTAEILVQQVKALAAALQCELSSDPAIA
jgi:CheY-like chemotaxis protein